MGPIATAASRVTWEHFCSLTLKGKFLGETEDGAAAHARRRILYAWFRKVEKAFGIPSGKLVFLAREESGEKTGRWHWHALLSGLYHVPGRGVIPSPNPKSDAFRIMALWEQCGSGAGMARVREYDAQLSGVSYVLKGLENLEFSYAGANAYELGKFAEDVEGRQLILAPQFVAKVDRLSRRNRRHRKARELKVVSRDRSAPGALPSVRKPATFKHDYDSTPAPRPKKRRRDWSWKPGHAKSSQSVNPGSLPA